MPRLQVVQPKAVFPHGAGFVLAFEFMLSDLAEVVRHAQRPLTQAQVKSYLQMLLKGVAFCHANNIVHRVSSSMGWGGTGGVAGLWVGQPLMKGMVRKGTEGAGPMGRRPGLGPWRRSGLALTWVPSLPSPPVPRSCGGSGGTDASLGALRT